MATVQERLAELEAEYAKKRAEIVKDETILGALPAWAKEYNHGSPHWYKLYGREVSLKWERERYPSFGDNLKSPDLAFVARLMAEYPPLPQVMVKDGCTSFRVASAAPEATERCQLTAVSPFTIRINSEDRTAAFEWAAVVGGFTTALAVVVPLPTGLGVLRVRIAEDRYGGRCVKDCEFEPKAAGARRIKWASGGPQYANDFTVFWEAPDYALADLLESLGKE